jgi:pimeloyl-ACP methyl ester carboxylesterase
MIVESDFEEGFAELSKDTIHYFATGEGQAIVCIHGGGPGATGFSNFKQNAFGLAAAGYRVIMVDLPQYGKSTKPRIDDVPLLDYFGATMAEFADKLNLGKSNWVGNSMGGGTSLYVAINRPDLVERLVLMGSAGWSQSVLQPSPMEGIKRIFDYYQGSGPSLEKMEALIKTFFYDHSKITPELIKERYESSIDPEIVAIRSDRERSGNAIINDYVSQLGQVQAPTLIIWGRDDRFVGVEAALGFLHRIPDARLYMIPRCGHWAQGEHPEEFNAICLEFLQGTIGGRPK